MGQTFSQHNHDQENDFIRVLHPQKACHKRSSSKYLSGKFLEAIPGSGLFE